MQDLNDLYIFAAVVEHRGFAPAARALGSPKSSLSRRIARLEARLGVRLIERTTRRFVVTEIGNEFYRHCQAVVAEARSAEDVVARHGSEPRGLVRLSCPVQIAQASLATLLPKFLAAHPLVKLQVLVTNRRIDLIEEGFDVALRVRARLDTDAELTLSVLGRERVLLVAAPGLIERLGSPETPDGLRALPTLSMRDEPGRDVWRLTAADGREHLFEHEPRLAAGDFKVLLQAAIAGEGVAFFPEAICCEPLRSGALIQLLPEWSELQGIAHLVFTTRRGQRPAVSALIDFLIEEMPSTLRAPDPSGARRAAETPR
jgi:DNA-binding transcriptional LysR family regulator